MKEGLRALQRSGWPVALVDGVTPYDFVPSFQAPYNSHSEALRVIDERVSCDATERELYAVAPDGARAGGLLRRGRR